jgi:hypothetical protein
MILIHKIKYRSNSSHNKICSGMNATNNYLFKYLLSKVLLIYEKQGVTLGPMTLLTTVCAGVSTAHLSGLYSA